MKQHNKDSLIGYNMPRAGYAISGSEWAITKGKDAPMIINLNTPGTFGDDWVATYGSSLDSFLSIIDGFKVVESIETISVDGVYKDGFPNTKTENLWQKVTHSSFPETPVQQVQYMVSGGDIETGRTRVDNFGEIFNTRGLCLRGPMMLCGYGRTKDMLPLTKDSDNERLNSEDSKLDPSLWKGGTIDVRWDERRNVWGAWQDIIVDHEDKGLGTTVFSTNPDLDKGFPYLKGKLEDVWWVRQPDSLKGTDGKVEGQQTAEIMTHLKHKFFDEGTDGSAKLETVFIIPHKDASEDEDSCHKKGEERTLGDEITGDGLAIDIRSTVHIWKEDEVDGPIKFGDKVSDIVDNISCINEDAHYFTGQMIFVDEAIITCASRDQAASATSAQSVGTGDKPPCEWVPAIQIDECELMGGHIGSLVQNDINIINKVDEICVAINSWSKGALTEGINNALGVVAGGVGEACDKTKAVADALTAALANLASQIEVVVDKLAEDTSKELNRLKDAINVILVECCEASIDIDFDITTDGHGFVTGGVTSTPCIVLPEFDGEFPCDPCGTVAISAPCAKNSDKSPFNIGFGCETGEQGAKPDYDDVGQHQANETVG